MPNIDANRDQLSHFELGYGTWRCHRLRLSHHSWRCGQYRTRPTVAGSFPPAGSATIPSSSIARARAHHPSITLTLKGWRSAHWTGFSSGLQKRKARLVECPQHLIPNVRTKIIGIQPDFRGWQRDSFVKDIPEVRSVRSQPTSKG